ncbi:protein phosphatase 2C domain-containing protein [Mesorhizobium sp. M0589]
MTLRRWSWVGACSTGTSHLRAGTGCDDAGACIEVDAPLGSSLILVVSDGAGSAEHSSVGSQIVTRTFCESVDLFLRSGGAAFEINTEVANEWIDDIRDRLAVAARRKGTSLKAFASTLVGCVIQSDVTVVIHVGDGACALRLTGDSEWHVPSWPAQGEFASTTFFVTDDPYPNFRITRTIGTVDEVAVFSDGLERLALDFGSKSAFAPFFDSMFNAIRDKEPGRQRGLSASLRHFLDSSSVGERTDDDKTLVMARRV